MAVTEGESDEKLTALLQHAARDDRQAKQRLYGAVYNQLRSIARHVMQGRNKDVFQTTSLVNEVVLRFEKGMVLQSISNRRVFFAVAVKAMNQVLIDHYRRRKKLVDGDGRNRQPLDKIIRQVEQENDCDFESLYLALSELEKQSPRQHAVMMHRYYGGLTIAQTAELLHVSEGTVERDWRLARAKLYRLLARDAR